MQDAQFCVWMSVGAGPYCLALCVQDIYLLGGHNGGAWLDSMHQYTPAYRSISDVGKMPFARGYGGAAIIGRSIYIVGGGDGASWLQTAVRYDIDTKEWFQVCLAIFNPLCMWELVKSYAFKQIWAPFLQEASLQAAFLLLT